MELQRFLKNTINHPPHHYLWLRSLSYLEYIGYRKMVKALDYQKVSREVYQHLSDEIHHSFMLKELAEKEFGYLDYLPKFDSEFIKIAESFFQKLDQDVDVWVEQQVGKKDRFLCYLLTSYLIEKRAMVVYPHYHQQLEGSIKSVIQKIIKDEKEHLEYLEEKLKTVPLAKDFQESEIWRLESRYFADYLNEFQTYAQRS